MRLRRKLDNWPRLAMLLKNRGTGIGCFLMILSGGITGCLYTMSRHVHDAMIPGQGCMPSSEAIDGVRGKWRGEKSHNSKVSTLPCKLLPSMRDGSPELSRIWGSATEDRTTREVGTESRGVDRYKVGPTLAALHQTLTCCARMGQDLSCIKSYRRERLRCSVGTHTSMSLAGCRLPCIFHA
jgi:hypothetical protein